MSVFVLAMNLERRKLFVWKCISSNEARGIQKRLYNAFGDTLSRLSTQDKPRDEFLYPSSLYDEVVNFTYENAKDYYIAGRGL